jgi:hypothetical protein
MSSEFQQGYPIKYKNDNEIGKLLQKMNKNEKKFTNTALANTTSVQYKQLNFPYNPDYITQISVGKNSKIPLGGNELAGHHTKNTCAMNAAIEYNKSNSMSLATKYDNDIFCKISKNGKILYEGFYSKLNVQELAAASAPATTTEPSPIVPTAEPMPYKVQLTGLILPSDGNRNGYIELTTGYPISGYKTFGIWIGIKPETCTQQNAMLYYENGALKTNSVTPILILKNKFWTFVMKYTVEDEKSIRFYPDTDGAKIPIVLKSTNKIIEYIIKTPQDGKTTENLVYYNFKESTNNLGKCIVYNSKNLSDADKTGIENSDNYDKQVVKEVAAFGVGNNVNGVGLNKNGVLTAYYTDPVIMPTPVTTNNGNVIEAKNKGRNGVNKKVKYVMVLDDSIKKMTDSKQTFGVPLETFDRLQLIKNEEWQKANSYYLSSIDNNGQTNNGPGMKITMDRPLFSKDYKLKMALEKSPTDTQYYLRIYKTIKNNNLIVSVFPDFKMGKLFVADENTTTKKMYLVKNENKITERVENGKIIHSVNDYPNYYPLSGYTDKNSNYNVFESKRIGYCKEKARGKNHFFVIEKKKKTLCVVPKKSYQKIVFLPKQPNTNITKSTLLVPNKSMTSGNVKTDANLKINKYKYLENAYSSKSYTDFKVSTNYWNPTINLIEQNLHYNKTMNYGRDAIGLNSKDTSKGVAEVMPIEKFKTYTEETIDQINNYTQPRFANYLDKQTRVNQNVKNISGNITQINDKYAFMSDTVARTQGVQNNEFYDFTGSEIYSLKEDRSLVPALLKDQQTMIVEHNNLFIVSTITVATLLVSAIFVSSN